MNLTIKNLENCFETAIKMGYLYVAVKIDMQGYNVPEIVINSRENFDAKLDYFRKAYDENLVFKNYPSIRIIGFTMADTFEDIEEDLQYGL